MTRRRFVNRLSGSTFDNDDLIRVRVELAQVLLGKRLTVEDDNAEGNIGQTCHVTTISSNDVSSSPPAIID